MPAPPGAAWRQVPAAPADGPGDRDLGRVLGAAVLAAAPPVAWALHQQVGQPLVLAVVAATVAFSIRQRWARPGVIVAIVAVATAAVAVLATPAVASWLALGLVTGRWLAAPRRRPFLAAAPAGAMVPAAFLAVVALVLAEVHRSALAIAIALVAAVVVPLVAMVTGGRSLAWVDRVAAAVAHGLLTVLFGVLSLPLVVLPHIYGRIAGADPFDTAGAWAMPPRRRSRAAATWSNDRPPRPRSLRRRATAVVAAAVLVATFAFAVQQRRGTATNPGFLIRPAPVDDPEATNRLPLRYPAPPGLKEQRVGSNEQPAAMRDSPWSATPAWKDALGNALDDVVATRPVNPYEMLDFRSRYVNIVDGHRLSWSPPACGCRRVTVWMYGGSTTWGMDQRDEHTIASELAREAYRHGLTVDVVNKGMNGFSHWQEAERLAWDLASAAKPDLVIFYDGVNDMMNHGDLERPVNSSADALWDHSGAADGPAPPAPDGARLLTPRMVGPAAAESGEAIAVRYARLTQMSRRTADAAGVPVRFVWQPSRYTRAFEPEEPHYATDVENYVRRFVQSACTHQAPGIIRACTALAGVRGPLFTDDAHHNERGARIIAGFLYRQLSADLRSLAAGRTID